MPKEWRPGPDLRAARFQYAFCDDPNCGLHLVALDASGSAICEIVMSPSQTLAVVEACQEHLYDKATRKI